MKKIAVLFALLLTLSASAASLEKVVLKVDNFNSIKASAVADLYLIHNPDSTGMIVYSIDPAVKDMILFSVSDNTLNVEMKKTFRENNFSWKDKVSKVIVYVTDSIEQILLTGTSDIKIPREIPVAKTLSIQITGSGDIDITTLTLNNLNLSVSGTGDIEIKKAVVDVADFNVSGTGDIEIDNFTAQEANLSISGTGDIEIEGQTHSAHMIVSGAGDANCNKLKANLVTANMSGVGGIKCYASEMINATVSGMGDIKVYGNPATAKISGKKQNVKIYK